MSPRGTLDSCDVAIVGGGVIGSAIAYFLSADETFTGRVVVIEKDPTYRACSTTRSVGGLRQQFSTPENIRMSLYSADFIKRADEFLDIDGEAPALSFVEAGYLLLATEAGADALAAGHAMQRSLGTDSTLLSKAGLVKRFPWLNVDDLSTGSLGLSREGWLDPHALLLGFSRKARRLGAEYVQGEVASIRIEHSKVQSIELTAGRRIHCGVLVNAAGPRAAQIASMAAVELPVRPRKRQVFVIACQERLSDCPMVVDPTGLYFRPEGETYICGISPRETDDPDSLDLDVDHGLFEEHIWPLLAHRVPAFEACKCVNAWAGQYAYNVFDQNAVIGTHPEVTNLIFANGFSGHGLQQSPAVGRAVCELICHGEYRSLDLSRFGFERFLENNPIRELNVV